MASGASSIVGAKTSDAIINIWDKLLKATEQEYSSSKDDNKPEEKNDDIKEMLRKKGLDKKGKNDTDYKKLLADTIKRQEAYKKRKDTSNPYPSDTVKIIFSRYSKDSPEENTCNCSEFLRQIKLQEDGMKRLTIDDFVKNRMYYLGFGRHIKSETSQQNERKKTIQAARDSRLEDYGSAKVTPASKSKRDPTEHKIHREAVKKHNEERKNMLQEIDDIIGEGLTDQHALHNSDMVSGGFYEVVGLGDGDVNVHMGGEWKRNVKNIEEGLFHATLPEFFTDFMTMDKKIKNKTLNIELKAEDCNKNPCSYIEANTDPKEEIGPGKKRDEMLIEMAQKKSNEKDKELKEKGRVDDEFIEKFSDYPK